MISTSYEPIPTILGPPLVCVVVTLSPSSSLPKILTIIWLAKGSSACPLSSSIFNPCICAIALALTIVTLSSVINCNMPTMTAARNGDVS